MATKKEIHTEEIVETEVKKLVAKAHCKYDPDEQITCRSITYGELLIVGPKSKLLYSWSNYGDTTPVEYQDLQALRSIRSAHLLKPRIIVEDEELIAQWGKDFENMYSKIVDVDVEKILDLPLGKFKTALKNAPNGVQQAVKNIAGEKILDGSLDSLAKIKAIDEILGTDLKLYLS
jgi:hypothetical protein